MSVKSEADLIEEDEDVCFVGFTLAFLLFPLALAWEKTCFLSTGLASMIKCDHGIFKQISNALCLFTQA